jgi:hypothetical protein
MVVPDAAAAHARALRRSTSGCDFGIGFDSIDHLKRLGPAQFVSQNVAHAVLRIAGEHPARIDVAESVHDDLRDTGRAHYRNRPRRVSLLTIEGNQVQPSATPIAQQVIHARLGGSNELSGHLRLPVRIQWIARRQAGDCDVRLVHTQLFRTELQKLRQGQSGVSVSLGNGAFHERFFGEQLVVSIDVSLHGVKAAGVVMADSHQVIDFLGAVRLNVT